MEDFRTLISEVPKSRQAPFQRPIIKEMSTEVCSVLGSRVSYFTGLLWCQNPQSKMTPQAARVSQPSRLRYSKKDFENQPTWSHFHEQLYALLQRHWPCSCGRNHESKLGDCQKIMLRLQSAWTHPELIAGEFDIKLQHDLANIDCNICIQAEKHVSSCYSDHDPPELSR